MPNNFGQTGRASLVGNNTARFNDAAKNALSTLAVVSACLFSLPSSAMAQTAPPGGTSTQAAPVGTMQVFAKKAEVSVEKPAVYRDPTKVLTIAEMSEIFTEKATADFYRKNGFTKDKPPPEIVDKAFVAPPVVVPLTITATYKDDRHMWAEASLNESVIRLEGGQRLTRLIAVKSVGTSGVVLTEYPKTFLKCLKRPSLRSCQKIQPQEINLTPGQTYSWTE